MGDSYEQEVSKCSLEMRKFSLEVSKTCWQNVSGKQENEKRHQLLKYFLSEKEKPKNDNMNLINGLKIEKNWKKSKNVLKWEQTTV